MKNVTVSLNENRIRAAEQGKSLSQFLGDLLEERMRHESDYETAYEAARRRFMAGKPFAFRQPGEKLPTRDEIHDRKRLRR